MKSKISFVLWASIFLGTIPAHGERPTRRPPAPTEPSRRLSEQALAAHEQGDHETARNLLREAVALRPGAQLWSFLAR